MEWALPVVIVWLVAVLLIAGLAIGFYNSLVRARNLVQNAWAQIDVQLRRRYDLIPNLVETVKGYASHEKEVFENVAQARSMAAGARGVQERQEAENMLSSTLRTLFAVAEAYPQLRASENFGQLQRELGETESKIAFSRQFYNDTVMKYNTRIQSFPANLVAGALGFHHVPYFQVEEAAVRSAPQVRF